MHIVYGWIICGCIVRHAMGDNEQIFLAVTAGDDGVWEEIAFWVVLGAVAITAWIVDRNR